MDHESEINNYTYIHTYIQTIYYEHATSADVLTLDTHRSVPYRAPNDILLRFTFAFFIYIGLSLFYSLSVFDYILVNHYGEFSFAGVFTLGIRCGSTVHQVLDMQCFLIYAVFVKLIMIVLSSCRSVSTFLSISFLSLRSPFNLFIGLSVSIPVMFCRLW